MSLVSPTLDDRKHFLACLAAILASSCELSGDKRQYQDDVKSSSVANEETQRYRQRKHKVASGILIQSAKHLSLDQYEAERWLPLLDVLLNPNNRNIDDRDRKEDVNDEDEQFELLEDSFGLLKSQVESITPGSGYLCLCIVLFEQLLTSEGYDARVRVILKRLGAGLWIHNNSSSSEEFSASQEKCQKDSYAKRVAWATRKFESLEQAMANRILLLAQQQSASPNSNESSSASENAKKKKQIIRGMQIGAAGVVAGTLLVVTGGMAAPGIAAGLGAIGVTTTTVLGINLLALATSTAALTLFGAAGGGLAMYKMNRRTEGLQEFTIYNSGSSNAATTLSRTIFLSGWLRDGFDFQRPFGVELVGIDEEKESDRLELLQRFYAIHNPENIQFAKQILEKYSDNDSHWKELWRLLETKYGADPSHLYPITEEETAAGNLTGAEVELLDQIIVQVGKAHEDESEGKQKEKKRFWNFRGSRKEEQAEKMVSRIKKESSEKNPSKLFESTSSSVSPINKDSVRENASIASDNNNPTEQQNGEDDFEKVVLGLSEDQRTKNPIEQKDGEGSFEKAFVDPSDDDITKNRTIQKDSEDGFNKVAVGPSNDQSTKKIVEQTLQSVSRHCPPVWDYCATYGGGELYSIRWESQLLLKLCRDNVLNDVMSVAGKEALRHTVASTLLAAAALPSAIFSAMNSIDEVWTLVTERSDAAGKELARILCSSRSGRRPVTLLGYSFGARAIFSCLKQLAKYQKEWELQQRDKNSCSSSILDANDKGKTEDGDDLFNDGKNKKNQELKLEFECEPASVVEDVILMGIPKYLGGPSWKECRQIVAGRFVNVYSRNDKILLYMFKYKRLLSGGILNKSVCGTTAVNVVPGIENLDVSDLVMKHTDYCLVIKAILQRLKHGQPLRCSPSSITEIEKETNMQEGVVEAAATENEED
mmetsp:Transcript_15633/g.23997  ORF Transcript_15633/g.23997 Transcript_15633/m.23997 type:complete len:936 (+) Transcript_15633:35-2842(+)